MNKKLTLILVAVFFMAAIFVPGDMQAEEPWAALEGESFDLVVGFGAGGSHDLSARYVAEALEKIGVDVSVVNMPGAVGTEAAYHVASQDPDSNILFWGHPPVMIFEPAARDIGYDYDDFDAVGAMGSPTFAIGSRADAPWEDLDDLREYMDENPGEVIVGGQGELHIMHYAVEAILPPDEYDYRYVAFAGGADVALNLTGGHADVGHLSLSAAKPLHDDDELTVMVHTSAVAERVDMMPDVPNVTEFGIDFTEPHTLSAWAPAGTDVETREALNAALAEITNDSDFLESMGDMGFVVSHHTIEETEDYFNSVRDELLPEFMDWLESKE